MERPPPAPNLHAAWRQGRVPIKLLLAGQARRSRPVDSSGRAHGIGNQRVAFFADRLEIMTLSEIVAARKKKKKKPATGGRGKGGGGKGGDRRAAGDSLTEAMKRRKKARKKNRRSVGLAAILKEHRKASKKTNRKTRKGSGKR